MLYLTARRAEDGMLFRVFLNPDDLRRLLKRAIEQEKTAAIVRQMLDGPDDNHRRGQ